MKNILLFLTIIFSISETKSQSFTKEELIVFAMFGDMKYIDHVLSEKKFRIYQTTKTTDGKKNMLMYKSSDEFFPEVIVIYKEINPTAKNREVSLLYSTVSENWYTSLKEQLLTDKLKADKAYHFVSADFEEGYYKTMYTNYVVDLTYYVAGPANKNSNWNCLYIRGVNIVSK